VPVRSTGHPINRGGPAVLRLRAVGGDPDLDELAGKALFAGRRLALPTRGRRQLLDAGLEG